MKCNDAIQEIVSDSRTRELTVHLHECNSCSTMEKMIEQQMNLLDRAVEVPDDLLAKTVELKSRVSIPRFPDVDYNKYLQLAAVVAVGIFLGIVLGRNANTELLASKKSKKDRALMEYRQSHQLNNETSIYKF